MEKKKRKGKAVTVKAKKKSAKARASVREGKGRITINKLNVNVFKPKYLQEYIKEPLDICGEFANTIDIEVSVHGGGNVAQAVCSRACIAKALVAFTKDKKLKEKFLKYDRMLLVDDSRRKEAKKPLGKGARKKRQLSFR